MKTDLLFSCYTPKAGCDHEREVLIPLKLVEKPKTGLSPLTPGKGRQQEFQPFLSIRFTFLHRSWGGGRAAGGPGSSFSQPPLG